MVGDGIATLYVTFFLRYISKDITIIIWIGLVLNILACIMSFFTVESPIWLLSVGRKEEAIKNLNFIAKMNGVKDFHIKELREIKFETVDSDKE